MHLCWCKQSENNMKLVIKGFFKLLTSQTVCIFNVKIQAGRNRFIFYFKKPLWTPSVIVNYYFYLYSIVWILYYTDLKINTIIQNIFFNIALTWFRKTNLISFGWEYMYLISIQNKNGSNFAIFINFSILEFYSNLIACKNILRHSTLRDIFFRKTIQDVCNPFHNTERGNTKKV